MPEDKVQQLRQQLLSAFQSNAELREQVSQDAIWKRGMTEDLLRFQQRIATKDGQLAELLVQNNILQDENQRLAQRASDLNEELRDAGRELREMEQELRAARYDREYGSC